MSYNSERLHTVEIHWGFPIPIESTYQNWKSQEQGLYYISRQFGDIETPIYIGKTEQGFNKRLEQHIKKKANFLDKRGQKYIRMGTIVKPLDISRYELSRLLLTIESAIITEVNQIINYSLCNRSQIGVYTRWYDLHIINSGKRVLIPRHIFNREH